MKLIIFVSIKHILNAATYMFRAWSRIHPKRLNKETHYGLGPSSLFGFKLAVVAVCLHFMLFNYAIDSFKSMVFFCCSLLLRTEFVFWCFLSLSNAFSALWPTSLNKRAIFWLESQGHRTKVLNLQMLRSPVWGILPLPQCTMHVFIVWASKLEFYLNCGIHIVCFF